VPLPPYIPKQDILLDMLFWHRLHCVLWDCIYTRYYLPMHARGICLSIKVRTRSSFESVDCPSYGPIDDIIRVLIICDDRGDMGNGLHTTYGSSKEFSADMSGTATTSKKPLAASEAKRSSVSHFAFEMSRTVPRTLQPRFRNWRMMRESRWPLLRGSRSPWGGSLART
jgi:hypothetical protein